MSAIVSVVKAVIYWCLHVEPALVAGAVVAVAALVAGVRTGNVDIALVVAALAAVQALFTRQNVSPTKPE